MTTRRSPWVTGVLSLAPGHTAMSECYLAPIEHVVPLPGGMPMEVLVQAQQLGTVLYASRRLPDVEGRNVAVIGQGSAGLWFRFPSPSPRRQTHRRPGYRTVSIGSIEVVWGRRRDQQRGMRSSTRTSATLRRRAGRRCGRSRRGSRFDQSGDRSGQEVWRDPLLRLPSGSDVFTELRCPVS